MGERRIFRRLATLEEALQALATHVPFKPLGVEETPLEAAAGRVLAEDVVAEVDVPGFDRAVMDGYAVRAEDTYGAGEQSPAVLEVVGSIPAGANPEIIIGPHQAAEISTGSPLPRGADAVVMVEYTRRVGSKLEVYRPVAPAENVMPTGADIMAGDVVLRQGQLLTPREVGMAAAIGCKSLRVFRRPQVAILSTGDELVSPGLELTYGKIYDVNSYSLAAAVHELGGEPHLLGVLPDDEATIEQVLEDALKRYDLVLTSGSTSAGAGDILYRLIDRLGSPGILVHGVALKPGKPTILAAIDGKAVIGLPGYPTSALIIFNTLVAPLLRALAGFPVEEKRTSLKVVMAERYFSAKGRKELLPVHLIEVEGKVLAYPVRSGSGAITTLGFADGYIEIPENQEFVDEGDHVEAYLLGTGLRPVDLVMIGSHDPTLEALLGELRSGGFSYKVVNVGSNAGVRAIQRGEADVAGIHILDEATGEYNVPVYRKYGLRDVAILVRGYRRLQGLLVAPGNPKGVRDVRDLLRPDVLLINRNPGSGTRILLDSLLREVARREGCEFDELCARIQGYTTVAKTHSAVASAVASGRADVGVGVKAAAERYGLEFIPLAEEHYDFLVRRDRLNRPAVARFLELLRDPEVQGRMNRAPGVMADADTGSVVLG
jgi:putative molybdopterin biosynthesis protein